MLEPKASSSSVPGKCRGFTYHDILNNNTNSQKVTSVEITAVTFEELPIKIIFAPKSYSRRIYGGVKSEAR